jgi:hypothetical protein
MLTNVQTASAPVTSVSVSGAEGTCGTPEMRMLVLMVRNQLEQGEAAKTTVTLNGEQLKELREAVREALEAAREANEDSGFWGAIGDVLGGDVAALAEVVAVAAAAVATGGAAALVIGALTIACSLASKYADELGIPKNVAMGLAVVAALGMVASGNLAASSSAASLGAAGGSAAAVGGQASQVGSLVNTAREVQFYASLAAPAARGLGAGANTVSGYYASEAIEHRASARAAQGQEQLASMDIDAAIDAFARTIDRQLAAFSEAASALEQNQQYSQLIAQSFQGMA